jgi:predicted RNase H-like HicB family nuclease
VKKKITRIIRKSGCWYIAYIKEIPSVNTQGRTLAEARLILNEALALITEIRVELRLCRHRKIGNKALF